jgi:hypothetical protein
MLIFTDWTVARANHEALRTSGSPLRLATAVIVGTLSLWAPPPAAADLGPCTTAAPTTRDVHLFLSDIDRAARWYRDNAGLTEQRRWVDQTFGGATLVSMQRGLAGVTLVSWPRELAGKFRDPQMVCLVLDGPPDPSYGKGADVPRRSRRHLGAARACTARHHTREEN